MIDAVATIEAVGLIAKSNNSSPNTISGGTIDSDAIVAIFWYSSKMSRWNDVQAESGSDDDWEVWCGDYGHPSMTFHTTYFVLHRLFSFSNTSTIFRSSIRDGEILFQTDADFVVRRVYSDAIFMVPAATLEIVTLLEWCSLLLYLLPKRI